MSMRAVEHSFGSGLTYDYTDPGAYDADKTGLGYLMKQDAAGWAGPYPLALARPMEASVAVPCGFPWAMRFNDTEDWIFCSDAAAAAATRRVVMFKYNRITNQLSWQGFVTITFPTATTFTIRSLRMTYDTYSTGTVAVSGTAVTGTGTAWQAARFAVGARIGFGTTDPKLVTQWYEISAIGSDTGITLTSSAGTIAGGTAFVIEELRAVILATNATATNGGLFVAKGLRPEIFSPTGTAIPAATTVDNIRASYWLADASTVTHTAGNGLAIQDKTSDTSHLVFGGNGTTTQQFFKYNLRAALTLTAGKATDAYVLKTAVSATLTGTASQNNNARLATLNHGPGNGLPCIYFATTTRIYRTIDVATITDGSTTFLADAMTEVPPGGTSTFAASSIMNNLEHMGSIDKLIICSTNASGVRGNYVTQYRTDAGNMDRMIWADSRQIQQSIADSTLGQHMTTLSLATQAWVEEGVAYVLTSGTLATTNFLYALPLGADWEYANDTDACIVTKRLATPNAISLSRALVNAVEIVGGANGLNLGIPPDPFRMYARTSGIEDDTGAWTLLDYDGDLSAFTPGEYVQLRFEFRTMSILCVGARICGLAITYSDDLADDHFQGSHKHTSLANKRFAWRMVDAFGAAIPDLRVLLYDAVTGGLLLDDDSDTPAGTWEQSTNDGGSWAAFDNTDKANEQHYLRYTPASLADNIRVRAVLALL